MRHPKIIIAGIGLAAVAAVGGGITAAVGRRAHPPAARPPPATAAAAATVRTAPATVAGKTETILVNAHGLPLYFYRPDTAAKSFVTGGLAPLWPPLTSAAPTATGAERQAHRAQRRPRPPGRLQRPPAVHLRRRPPRPGDRPGRPELLRGHPRPRAAHRVPGRRTGPGRPGRRPLRLLTRQARPGPPTSFHARTADASGPMARRQADMTVTRPASAGARRTWLRPAPRCRAGHHGRPGTRAPAPRARVSSMARIAAAIVAVAALAAAGVAERAAADRIVRGAGSSALALDPGRHRARIGVHGRLRDHAAPAARGRRRQRRVSGRCWPPPMRPTRCRSRFRWPDPGWPRRFTFRRFTRQGADAPLAGWSLLAGGVVSSAAAALVVVGGGAGVREHPGRSGRRSRRRARRSRPRRGRERPRAGRGCAARSNGPPRGRYGTDPGCCAGPPPIPARPSGPGLSGWARSGFPRRAG